eukprot:scaffold145031_cov67-Attheya_sp.AAC.1
MSNSAAIGADDMTTDSEVDVELAVPTSLNVTEGQSVQGPTNKKSIFEAGLHANANTSNREEDMFEEALTALDAMHNSDHNCIVSSVGKDLGDDEDSETGTRSTLSDTELTAKGHITPSRVATKTALDFDTEATIYPSAINKGVAIGRDDSDGEPGYKKIKKYRRMSNFVIAITISFIITAIAVSIVGTFSKQKSIPPLVTTVAPTISQTPTISKTPPISQSPTVSSQPTMLPTMLPTSATPTSAPSTNPTNTMIPSSLPSQSPTRGPTYQPSAGVTDLSILVSQSTSPNRDVVVPAGIIALIDGNIDAGQIDVQGELRCHPGVKVAKLRTDGIMMGRTGALFSCGSITDPFKNKVIIELKGNRDFGMGVRALGARSGGIIALHGETSN